MTVTLRSSSSGGGRSNVEFVVPGDGGAQQGPRMGSGCRKAGGMEGPRT